MNATMKGVEETLQNLFLVVQELQPKTNHKQHQHVEENSAQGSSSDHNAGSRFVPNYESETNYVIWLNRGIRIEISNFDGEGVEEWIFKAQQYCEMYEIPFEHRIRVVSFHLSRAAYSWYRWSVNNHISYTWETFLDALRMRFGVNLFHDPKAALKELKQVGSVFEYQRMFEDISNEVTGLSEDWLVAFFHCGFAGIFEV